MEISSYSLGHFAGSDLREKRTAENCAMISVKLQLALHRASFFGNIYIYYIAYILFFHQSYLTPERGCKNSRSSWSKNYILPKVNIASESTRI